MTKNRVGSGARLSRAVGAALAVVMTAACAATTATTDAATATYTPTTAAGSDPHEKVAVAEALRIIGSYVGPPGSAIADVETSGIPGVMTSPSQHSNGSQADAVGWLIVPGTPQDALTWAKDHPPAGSTLGDYSRWMVNGHLGGDYGEEWEFDYSQPAIPASAVSQRTLSVQTAKLPSGKTVMRLAVDVAWLPTRPAGEVIPETATAVTTVAVNPDHPTFVTKSETTPTTTSDPAKVRQIVAWVNALPMANEIVRSCPPGPGTHVTMTFRNGVDGPVVATLDTYLGGCSTVQLTLAGVKWPQLLPFVNNGSLVPQVDALLGIKTCPVELMPCQ